VASRRLKLSGSELDGGLLTFARPELLERIAAARQRVWLASPFITAPIAAQIGDAAAQSSAKDLRLLTALTPRSVQVGVLSPAALAHLRKRDFRIATIPNLHAKVNLVDSGWCLVGSGNLTGTGLGGAEGGNVELGVLLNAAQIRSAAALLEGWWEQEADPVGDEEIAAYAALPKFPWRGSAPRPAGAPLGLVGVAGLEGLLAEHASLNPDRRYWIKSNYHRPDEQQWWHRDWISDWRQGPYAKDDLIVLYLSARDGGPACCPAVVRVTVPSIHDPQWVIEHRDPNAAERWPYVTRTAVVGEVPIAAGAGLSAIGKSGQSLQGGYCSIDRGDFEKLVTEMLGS